jgi:hypothetical protein
VLRGERLQYERWGYRRLRECAPLQEPGTVEYELLHVDWRQYGG